MEKKENLRSQFCGLGTKSRVDQERERSPGVFYEALLADDTHVKAKQPMCFSGPDRMFVEKETRQPVIHPGSHCPAQYDGHAT